MTARGPPARLLLAAALAALLACAAPAAAHALLVDAQPNPDTRVDRAPDRLQLSFSEPLEDAYTRVQVVGPNGTDHVTNYTIEEPNRKQITADLEELPDGLYSVRWRTLSTADGHTKASSYLLAVNTSLVPTEGDSGAQAPGTVNATTPQTAGPGWGEALTRGLAFVGASLVAGLPLVLLTLPGSGLPDRLQRRLTQAGALAGGLAAVACLGLVALLASRIGTDVATAVGTQNGFRQLVRAGALALAAGLSGLACLPETGRRRGALLGSTATAGVGALLATSLAGHAAGAGTLSVVVDLLHQTAVAYWVAGVGVLAVLAAAPETPTEALSAAVRRLSPAFVVAVVLVVLTGTQASWVHLESFGQLVTSDYGQALVVKIALLGGLVGLGWYHRDVLTARLGNEGSRNRLRKTVVVELAVMLAVLGAAGALTNTAPPTQTTPASVNATPNGTADETTGPPDLGPLVHDANESGYRFEVAIRPHPVTVGGQNVSVRVTGAELPENASLGMNLKPPSDPYGEGETRQLDRWTNRTWTSEGPIFTEDGEWRLLVFLQGKGAYASTDFTLDVQRR